MSKAKYVKLDQREHVLLRPDSYVGSTEPTTKEIWLVSPKVVADNSSLQDSKQEEASQASKQEASKQEEAQKQEGMDGKQDLSEASCGEASTEDSNGVDASSSDGLDGLSKKAKMQAECRAEWRLRKQSIEFVPALYKIFDEILVNSADAKTRDPQGVTWIKVWIEDHRVVVHNNGRGIEVEVDAKHGVYNADLIFGHLLTSDNYSDKEQKLTGGRNGFGAKLCNIFSKKFVVETVCSNKKFSITYSNNMSKKSKPRILTATKQKDSTKITFEPDFARFNMQSLTPSMRLLFERRVLDLAATTNAKVYLNDKLVGVRSFPDYVACFSGLGKLVFAKPKPRWEVAVATNLSGTFEQVSFVNSVWTVGGGTHVTHVTDQVVDYLEGIVANRNKKGPKITRFTIKNFLAVFVKCLIENPSFDSQSKEVLTSKPQRFGSECKLDESFLKRLVKTDLVEHILASNEAKSFKVSTRITKTKNLKVDKLDDANFAGTSRSNKCTLILTEGDSAKTLAVSGFSVVGRDYYGVFPLKGKPLNVREARHDQVTSNQEVQNIIKILGLRRDVEYTKDNLVTLRYGRLMIMTDQDHDGSHIKGLLINLLHWYNPSILKVPNFLCEFITPIVKVEKTKHTPTLKSINKSTKRAKKSTSQSNQVGNQVGNQEEDLQVGQSKSFFTLKEYENWWEKQEAKSCYKAKYYKGLGTSTAKEAKEYFGNLGLHEVAFEWREGDQALVELAFGKKFANQRKTWISSIDHAKYVDYNVKTMKYDDFFNREFVLFSWASVVRGIPSVVDGLKPSQRKVLFGCFKRNLRSDVKVAQLAGYIAEHSMYHHGEVSLVNTIINMAQNFVGSNNINLLKPSGQFGTRLMGGQDSASPRYIFTCLEDLTSLLFCAHKDGKCLKYLEEDGTTIEPEFYAPIIPMVLVNGAEGIATGWSCSVPSYNPLDVLANTEHLVRHEPLKDMTPWYAGFTGSIKPTLKQEPTSKQDDPSMQEASMLEASMQEVNVRKARSFTTCGNARRVGQRCILIDELPVGMWTSTYKTFLEDLCWQESKASTTSTTTTKKEGKKEAKKEGKKEAKKAKKARFSIVQFKENHTDTKVSFTVEFGQDTTELFGEDLMKGSFPKEFRLVNLVSENNMVLIKPETMAPHRYASTDEIFLDFYKIRLDLYAKRRELDLKDLTEEHEKLSNQARFITQVLDGHMVLARRSRGDIVAELKAKSFLAIISTTSSTNASTTLSSPPTNIGASPCDEDAHVETEVQSGDGFAYLLDMKLTSLTKERVEELAKQVASRASSLATLKGTTPEQLWLADLAALRPALESFLMQAGQDVVSSKKKKQNVPRVASTSKPTKRKAI